MKSRSVRVGRRRREYREKRREYIFAARDEPKTTKKTGTEQGGEQGKKEGMKAGAKKEKADMAPAVKAEGYDLEAIDRLTGLPPEKIQGLGRGASSE